MNDCSFSLEHYGALTFAAVSAGYRWAFFGEEPRAGDLFLRHDVDLSLEAALDLARWENEHGVRATYFVMTRSPFYNLDAEAYAGVVADLRGLGHQVGLHAVWPDDDVERLDELQLGALLSWHTPEPEFMSEPIHGVLNVYAPPWFERGRYRSDSNGRWREGCPCQELREGRHEWLQILVHPETWVFPGATMKTKLVAMLNADRSRRWDWVREFRIDV